MSGGEVYLSRRVEEIEKKNRRRVAWEREAVLTKLAICLPRDFDFEYKERDGGDSALFVLCRRVGDEKNVHFFISYII